MNENNYKNKILSINTKTIDFNFNNTINYNNNNNNIREKIVSIKEKIIIDKDKDKDKEKENIDVNVQKDNNNDINTLKEPSSILNPDEIPMDSVPKDYRSERESLEVKDNIKNKKKILSDIEVSKKIKEDVNEFNKHLAQRLSNIENYYKTEKIDRNNKHKKPKNQNLKEKKIKIKIKKDELKQVSDNLSKRPRNNIKIPVNNIKREKKNNSKIKEKIVIEYNPDNKSNSNTNDYSTTFNSILDYRYADANDSKAKYSSKAQEFSKTSFANNKTIPIYKKDKNIILINDAKVSHLTNSAPKNNEKIFNNYYTENKYPHNNHTSKKNQTCAKKMGNISKYNIDNIDNNNKENRNNENYMNINHFYKTANNTMNNTINTDNSIKVDVNSNTINGTSYNKKNLYDLFNDLQLIQKNQKKVNNQNNNNDYFNNFDINNINRNEEPIFVNYSVEKKKDKNTYE
jgi:hypothetical protein